MRASTQVTLLLMVPLSIGALRVSAQSSRMSAADLQGTWHVQSSKNLKTGAVRRYNDRTFWLQFTKTHWMLASMVNDRPKLNDDEIAKTTPDDRMKKQYSLIWNNKGEQIVSARGGTYTVSGNVVNAKRLFALIHSTVGDTDVLTIKRLDRTTLVYTIPGGVQTVDPAEVTATRLD